MEQRKPPSFSWLYGLALMLALAVFGVGLYLAIAGLGLAMLAVGCATIVVVISLLPISLNFSAARRDDRLHQENLLNTLTDRLQQISVMLNLISEQQLLSDRAKSVAFRETDRDALRRGIRDEIARQDFEAALVLANDMETTFGYKQEADRFREEVEQKRQDVKRKQIADAVLIIDRHAQAEQWTQATREAERIMQIFPDEEQVRRLPQEIETRRQTHKRQLLDSWNDAVARHDVDGGIEILKKLDAYLTSAEAESMQETARSVFKEKLNNLRTQFSLAVQDHKWNEAIRLGERIIRDFPNSGIAREVRETMDTLRQRAGEPAAATA